MFFNIKSKLTTKLIKLNLIALDFIETILTLAFAPTNFRKGNPDRAKYSLRGSGMADLERAKILRPIGGDRLSKVRVFDQIIRCPRTDGSSLSASN
jgi:hypothetical protein